MPDIPQDSAADAKAWVEANRPVIDAVYQSFLDSGEWPTIGDLQRTFDRGGITIDIREVLNAKPRVLNEARIALPDRLTLEVRHLMWVENAGTLVNICVTTVQRAVDAYLSDEPEPFVTSEDSLTTFPSDRSGGLRKRVYGVLTRENPSPFGGSSMNDEGSWRINVDGRFARRFRDVQTVEDYIACQDEIRRDIAREASAMSASFPASGVFNPFEQTGGEYYPSDAAPGAIVPETAPVLFLSWSRTTSRAVASVLHPILESRLPGVEVFFSPTSIEPGDNPMRRMFEEGLLASQALVVVLTGHSAESPYVIWETAAGWARDQLVIPIFVDIEPAAVPGPLTDVVQGVHMHDRADMDRAIQRLASRFGVPSVSRLSEIEHAALLEASQTSDDTDNGLVVPTAVRPESRLHVVRGSPFPPTWTRVDAPERGPMIAWQCQLIVTNGGTRPDAPVNGELSWSGRVTSFTAPLSRPGQPAVTTLAPNESATLMLNAWTPLKDGETPDGNLSADLRLFDRFEGSSNTVRVTFSLPPMSAVLPET
jgi:hypothetical protein